MSSSGRSPWKEVNRHIRGFDSLNCLKPYWLRIMIISVLFFYAASTIAISLEELIKYLTTYIYEVDFGIIGSFSVASHYIIRLKNIFYQLFFKLWWFHLYIRAYVAMRGIPLYSRNTARRHMCVYVYVCTKASNQSDFTWCWVLWLPDFDFYIFILLNKYITFLGLYILAEKILKKSKKIMKLGCFRLYNILGS